MARPKAKRARHNAAPAPPAAAGPALGLLDLDDGVLLNIVRRLGVDRRTIMLACKRLRDVAQTCVHSRQLPGMSVQDAVEAAQPGDTVHLLPGQYKEALLLKKPMHLVCDGPEPACILSPARFAVMCNARGCQLENLVLKSHQIDESVFFLVEYGPLCSFIRMRRCEVLQGSFVGIQDLKGPNTRMQLERCLLHVGVSLMAGRLDMTDTTVKCCGDSLWAYPGTTLVMRRCSFIDITDTIVVESETAVVQECRVWAYDRGPLVVAPHGLPPEEAAAVVNGERLLHVEEEPPTDVWVSLPRGPAGPDGIPATGRRADAEQRAAVARGEVLPGHVVLWGFHSFESRSNEGITAQQEEVRREARALMAGMQRTMDAEQGWDPEEFSIGNSVEDPEVMPGEESVDEDDWDTSDDEGVWEDEAGAMMAASDLSGSSGGSSEGISSSSSEEEEEAGGGPPPGAVPIGDFLPLHEYQLGPASSSDSDSDSDSDSGSDLNSDLESDSDSDPNAGSVSESDSDSDSDSDSGGAGPPPAAVAPLPAAAAIGNMQHGHQALSASDGRDTSSSSDGSEPEGPQRRPPAGPRHRDEEGSSSSDGGSDEDGRHGSSSDEGSSGSGSSDSEDNDDVSSSGSEESSSEAEEE